MKLGREISRRDKDGNPYYKWRVTLPERQVEALGWEPGDELDTTVEGDTLVVRRV